MYGNSNITDRTDKKITECNGYKRPAVLPQAYACRIATSVMTTCHLETVSVHSSHEPKQLTAAMALQAVAQSQ